MRRFVELDNKFLSSSAWSSFGTPFGCSPMLQASVQPACGRVLVLSAPGVAGAGLCLVDVFGGLSWRRSFLAAEGGPTAGGQSSAVTLIETPAHEQLMIFCSNLDWWLKFCYDACNVFDVA